MISQALELYVEGGRVSHSWSMCVVSRGCDRLDEGSGGWYACRTKAGGLVPCREMPEHIQSASCYTTVQLWAKSSRNRSVFLESP